MTIITSAWTNPASPVNPGKQVFIDTTLSVADIKDGLWTKNSVRLTSKGNVLIATLGPIQRLLLMNVQSSDAGIYTYIYGAQRTSVKLEVKATGGKCLRAAC